MASSAYRSYGGVDGGRSRTPSPPFQDTPNTLSSQYLTPTPGRKVTCPHSQLLHRKPRRWPLVLRFIKGAIHRDVGVPLVLHSLFTTLIALLHVRLEHNFALPASVVSSLSIVVGLMLVFRNQTAYQRFWDGRNNFAVCITSVRNLTRSFLVCSGGPGGAKQLSEPERADVERTARILLAVPDSIKNTLRAEWGMLSNEVDNQGHGLLPRGLQNHEDEGLALPVQLTFFVEAFIARGHARGWFHAPQASQLTVQVNTLVDAFSKMETIRLTQFPVAILIHQRQVLALFGCVLPFAVVDESHWWSVPIVALIMFALYGIEAIACQLEDPFGYDRNDIKMDVIVEDVRVELGVMLDEWRSTVTGPVKKAMFEHDV
ncbi:hypothetical protein VMCG_10418 [Cytospora schulzeri]|uniref:Uncharacterized protein n=1 Tax=Cytospora schulzeri TaxID=448051 RepID=A0A423VB68_9PEZI|nr:hypothetical protein VMCG_10418 [Valsa malicola]